MLSFFICLNILHVDTNNLNKKIHIAPIFHGTQACA